MWRWPRSSSIIIYCYSNTREDKFRDADWSHLKNTIVNPHKDDAFLLCCQKSRSSSPALVVSSSSRGRKEPGMECRVHYGNFASASKWCENSPTVGHQHETLDKSCLRQIQLKQVWVFCFLLKEILIFRLKIDKFNLFISSHKFMSRHYFENFLQLS